MSKLVFYKQSHIHCIDSWFHDETEAKEEKKSPTYSNRNRSKNCAAMTHRFRNIPFTNTLSLFSEVIKSFSNIVKVILWYSKTVGAVFFIAAQCKGSYFGKAYIYAGGSERIG
ncbi:hypothetical protein CEXT_367141 [Caerostris extrusa]|uniref:Uncharacterized protein n=1 Tax=Caerostris extrusa TaxID=172846 RepID=A0AAV4MMZ7_CAEEX|nr:hypothetical protein CEXT_367141 [Caerostris extrusa]